MAIPGAFAPVVSDHYVLSDGYVVRNLPIDVARELCGDVVIAVNLTKQKATREQLGGPASLIWRSSDIMYPGFVHQVVALAAYLFII